MFTIGSLFSGIGGLELGLERAGMRTVWQVEKDDYCRRVLAKHWPDVQRFDDVCTVGAHNLQSVDLICGGFPCQDISNAGRGAGINEGTRSGLWFEYRRIIRELRPRYVLVENVSALLARGIDTVLGDLAESGYDAEWDCIPAAAVGAPHRRDRVFIVAHTDESLCNSRAESTGRQARSDIGWSGTRSAVANPIGEHAERRRTSGYVVGACGEAEGEAQQRQRCWDATGDRCEVVADADCEWQSQPQGPIEEQRGRSSDSGENVPNAECAGWDERWGPVTGETEGGRSSGYPEGRHALSDWWAVEPDVGRVAHGVPARVDRLRALGNAVVPQVAEYIGQLIVAADVGCVS